MGSPAAGEALSVYNRAGVPVVEIVSAIAKVRHIHNEVTIAAPNSMMSRTNDGVLTTKVKTNMFGTAEMNATEIRVVSEAGVVYLMGLV